MRIFKILLTYSKKYNWLLFIMILTFIFGTVCKMLMPVIQKHIIDDCFSKLNFDKLYLLFFVYIGLLLLFVIFDFLQQYISCLYSEYATYELRNKLLDHIQKLSLKNHNSVENGQLISRITNDMDDIKEFYGYFIKECLTFIFIFLGCSISCFFISIKLFLVVFILFVAMFFISKDYAKKLFPFVLSFKNIMGVNTSFLNLNFLGIKVVKVFANEFIQIKKSNKINEDLYNISCYGAKVDSVYQPLLSFVVFISIVVSLFYGGYLYINGQITLGGIYVFILYFSMLIESLMELPHLVYSFQAGMGSCKRIFQIMDMQSEVDDNGYIDARDLKGNIEYKNVNFEFSDGTKALKNINFSVNHGETIGIIGTTGTGKSALINLLCRFYDVSSGEILLDGHNIKEYKLNSLRKNISLVSQETFLFSNSIKYNISYPKNSSIDNIHSVAKISNIHDFIMSLKYKYDTIIGDQGQDLSGGQKQRISIARALLPNSNILVLDDATSAVDAYTEDLINDALKEFSGKKTIFYITQKVSSLVNADKIIILDKGIIVQEGTHEELISKEGYYKEMYNFNK